jgi:hypothetical protein
MYRKNRQLSLKVLGLRERLGRGERQVSKVFKVMLAHKEWLVLLVLLGTLAATEPLALKDRWDRVATIVKYNVCE